MEMKITIKHHTTISERGHGRYQAYYWAGNQERPGMAHAGIWRPIGIIHNTKRAAMDECRMFVADSNREVTA
jgi:hypothetical protein